MLKTKLKNSKKRILGQKCQKSENWIETAKLLELKREDVKRVAY